MRKRKWLIVAAVVMVVAVRLAWGIFSTEPGVNAANFRRLYVGMPLQEAVSILGRPADVNLPRGRWDSADWIEGTYWITLFHENGIILNGHSANGYQFLGFVGEEISVLDRVRQWLRL